MPDPKLDATMRPCPFCGSDRVGLEDGIVGYYVSCNDCEASGPLYSGDDSLEALKLWDLRVQP